MSVSTTTNYGLTRVRDQGPEANDWAATDKNPELISDILKAFEQHAHNGNTPPTFPGYYAPPTAPTITPQGTSGVTTYSYYIVANTATFDFVSQIGTTTSGNATLTSVNKNHITWTAVPGATSYDVIRTVGGTTQGSIALATGGTSFDDTGIAATLYTPAIQPNVTQTSTGGVLAPGTSVGIRLSYVNALGLETQASPERIYSIPVTGAAPNAPSITSIQGATPGLAGGTYFYVLTKTKGSGETVISEVTPISIPFDTTYSVTLGFSAINSYADGTDGLNLYRSTGLNSSFQLITQISTVTTATFTDTNNILAQNTNRQPPTTSTFGASAKLIIDWSLLTHPTTVSNMNVYLTQQPGVWTTNHLLTQVAITSGTPASTFINYLGNESLGAGAPTESTQIPANPPLIDLGTQATGAPVLTANMNFAGFMAQNMKLHATTSPTVADGVVYYDTSIPTVRARINGAWVNWGTSTASAYTHPAQESGGHNATNIVFGTSTVDTVLSEIVNSVDGTRKQVQTVQKVAGSSTSIATTSTIPIAVSDMTVTISPVFNNQWCEVDFQSHFMLDRAGSTANIAIEYAGSKQEETQRSVTATLSNANVSLSSKLYIQLPVAGTNYNFKGLYWTDTGTTITAIGYHRAMTAKLVF